MKIGHRSRHNYEIRSLDVDISPPVSLQSFQHNFKTLHLHSVFSWSISARSSEYRNFHPTPPRTSCPSMSITIYYGHLDSYNKPAEIIFHQFYIFFLTLGVRQGLSHNVRATSPRHGSGSWIRAFILCELDFAFKSFGDWQFSREN